ncbi:MAG: putative Alkaline phosphatase [Candidatus Parcubacteria bacterium]|nr:putative Alkaline phosphatase [Candidatus Parcubacteria bacterium]
MYVHTIHHVRKATVCVTLASVLFIICFSIIPFYARAAGVVDIVPGASNGYALRSLRTSYTGPLIRVRTTASVKADVSADAQGLLSLSSPVTIVSGSSSATNLGSLISGTSAFVETWYDQVGTADLKQATASAQPAIAIDGTLLGAGMQNRPIAQFDGSNDVIQSSVSVSFSQPATVFVVATTSASQLSSARMFHVGGATSNRIMYQVVAGGGMYAGSSATATRIPQPFDLKVLSMSFNSASSAMWANGVANGTGNVGANTVSGNIYLGTTPTSASSYFRGGISEFILYPSSLSASSRQSIESDEMNYFINGAPSAPSVSPLSPTNVASSTATLNANVGSTGNSTVLDRGFNYGPSSSYGSTASTSGSFGAGSFSQDITGLSCGLSYHFQAFATNAVGTTYTADQLFSTSCIAGVLTITMPARAVAASSSAATISYVDQRGNTVYVPYIQSNPNLNVAASPSVSGLIPPAGGIKFVLNEGQSNEISAYSMAAPYSTTFTGLAKGLYTLDAYVVDSSQTVVVGSNAHDFATNIGIGDIYLAVGDSITKGSNGSGCSASVITNWLQADQTRMSRDSRNYCQWASTGTAAYMKSWMPELNNELEAYYGYPVFIMNEGYSGYTSNNYLTKTMNAADWKARVTKLMPNKAVILLSTNDTGPVGSTTANITNIITKLIGTYHIASSSIYIGQPLYASSRPTVQGYIQPLRDLVPKLGVQLGANFSNFFQNHPELYSDTPPIHPNPTGYLSVARLWGLALIKPATVTASPTQTGIDLTWQDLAPFDAIPTGKAGIVAYQISYGTTSGAYPTTIVTTSTSTSASIIGLTPGQTYYFTVAARGLTADRYFSATSTEVSATYTGL